MASTTTKRGLRKPSGSDYVKVLTDISNNMDNLDDAVPDSRTVNGHALSSDVTVTAGDVGLGNVENEIDDLKSALSDFSGIEIIEMTEGKYINTAVSPVNLTKISQPGWSCGVIDCQENDVFTINGTGGSTPYLWCFIDSNNNAITRSASGAVGNNLIIKAPVNAAKLVINSTTSTVGTNTKGIFPDIEIEELKAENTKLNNKLNNKIMTEQLSEKYDADSITGGIADAPFNISWLTGLAYDNGGVVAINSSLTGYKYTSFLCNAGEKYHVDLYLAGAGHYAYFMTDTSNNIIEYGDKGNDTSVIHCVKDIVIPYGISKMWVSAKASESYSVVKKQYPQMVLEKNLQESHEIEYTENVGLAYGNVGSEITISPSFTAYKYTQIDVNPGEQYRITAILGGGGNNAWIVTDESNIILEKGEYGKDNFYLSVCSEFVIPANGAKLYCSWIENAFSIRRVKTIDSDFFKTSEILNVRNYTGIVTNVSNFKPTADSSFTSYKYGAVRCKPGERFHVDGYYGGGGDKFVIELDELGNPNGKYIQGSDSAIVHYNADYIASDNCYGICFCWMGAYPFVLEAYKTYPYSKVLEELNESGKYKGKKIIYFGTSIFAGTVAIDGITYSIPSYVGKLLGTETINQAIGESMARRGWYESISENDSYGWTGHHWANVFKGMGKNLTEAQDLIDNYGSKWRDLLIGDNKPSAPLSDYYINDWIKASSYVNLLMPYLDGTYEMPDLFVFEHGHNDATQNMTGIPSVNPDSISDYNRSKYGDVMAMYIRLIRQANPKAKILIVSNYENDSTQFGMAYGAQKEVAEFNKVWFCDIANKIGWSDVDKITTTGYWDNGYWVNSGGTQRTITCLTAAFPDRIHPFTDLSGNAVIREATMIASFIKESGILEIP